MRKTPPGRLTFLSYRSRRATRGKSRTPSLARASYVLADAVIGVLLTATSGPQPLRITDAILLLLQG
jgi:hypothetical protein